MTTLHKQLGYSLQIAAGCYSEEEGRNAEDLVKQRPINCGDGHTSQQRLRSSRIFGCVGTCLPIIPIIFWSSRVVGTDLISKSSIFSP